MIRALSTAAALVLLAAVPRQLFAQTPTVTLTADVPLTDLHEGSPITWTAAASGGTAPYTYAFYLNDGATWTLARDWSAANTWTWTPELPGVYVVQVWVRNAGSPNTVDAWQTVGTQVESDGPFEFLSFTLSPSTVAAGSPVTGKAIAHGGASGYGFSFYVYDGVEWTSPPTIQNRMTWTPRRPGRYNLQAWVHDRNQTFAWLPAGPYTVTMPSAITVTAVTPDRPWSSSAGSPVTWDATVMGGTGPYSYKFWVYDGAAWTLGRDWSASNTWTWLPTTPGTYNFQIWARNAGSAATFDAYGGASYLVTAPSMLFDTSIPDHDFPLPAGTPVTWKADGYGGTGPYTFRFLVYDYSTWTVVHEWSADPTWIWVPPTAGTYLYQIWIRNAGSSAPYDSYGVRQVQVTAPAPLEVTALTASPPPVATLPLTLAATATGGLGPYTYEFWVYDGATWSLGCAWSASNTCSWTPPAPGTYEIQLWVRNAGSGAVWDAWSGMQIDAFDPFDP